MKREKWIIVLCFALFSCGKQGVQSYGTGSAQVSIAHLFKLPIENYNQNLIQKFDEVNPQYPGKCQHHAGHDIGAKPYTPVYAFANGDIVFSDVASNYGRVVVIQHRTADNKFFISIYGHLSSTEGKMPRGKGPVEAGELIGYIGNDFENGVGGPHLHFGIRKGEYSGKFEGVKCNSDEIRQLFYDPCEFIDVPCMYTNSRSVGVINYRLNRLDHTKKGARGIHWYGHYDGKVAIQDVNHAGCDAAVVYDYENNAHSAYLIKCGMWKKWSEMGGPASILGMPITEEYLYSRNRKYEIHQDFQNAFLVYNIKSHEINVQTYRYATPGKLEGAKWDGATSYAFVEEYKYHGGKQTLGDAMPPPHGGSQEVHRWNNFFVQDFNYGEYGWAIIMFNKKNGKASLIRSGIWNAYRAKNMINILGAPTFREYFWKGDKNRPRQDFDNGYIEFNRGQLNICLWDGVPACSGCGHCNTAPEKICIPSQTVCEGNIMKKCAEHGRGWIRTECEHGCSNNQCNICKPGTTWCHSSIEMQKCDADGKTFTSTMCENSCQNNTCQQKKLCVANEKKCINNEIRQCSSDGNAWIFQYQCPNGCNNSECLDNAKKCSIIFDKATRKMSISGLQSISYFTTWCADISQKDCWHQHHKNDGLNLIVPEKHNRINPRGQNDEWVYSVRECQMNSLEWIEDPKGGYLQIQ